MPLEKEFENRKLLLTRLRNLLRKSFFPDPHFCKSGDYIATYQLNASGEPEIVYIKKIQKDNGEEF